jgi:hypothetical protein
MWQIAFIFICLDGFGSRLKNPSKDAKSCGDSFLLQQRTSVFLTGIIKWMHTTEHRLPPFKSFLPSTLILLILGWGGLAAIFYFTLPLVWARWGFFVLGIMALTGTALPIVYFLHYRFPSDSPAEANVIVRQALWVGVYGATLAWLQLGRLVTLYVILGLAAGLIAAEYFIRIREKARWQPPTSHDHST